MAVKLASVNDLHMLYDPQQLGTSTFHSARWQRDFSPDLRWITTSQWTPTARRLHGPEQVSTQPASPITDSRWTSVASYPKQTCSVLELPQGQLGKIYGCY